MTQKTRANFKSDKNTAFADNSAGDISAGDLRGEMDHLADSATFPEDLASTSNGQGASLVSIEDSGDLIAATTVEGALAENRAAIDALEAAGYITGYTVTESDVTAHEAALTLTGGQVTAAGGALSATLASTANGAGASLIGIEDSGTLITATTVEGALAELAAASASGGDAWGDSVDADIIPDGDGTRDLGSAAAQFGEVHTVDLYVGGEQVTTVSAPAGDAIAFYDDSASSMAYLTTLTGLSISGAALVADVQSVAGETGAITAGDLRTALNVADGATANAGALADLDEVGISEIDATGTASGTTYLRGDGAWATPAGGGVTAAEAREVDLEAQTATSYSLVAADNGKTKQCNNASAITVTIPANATTAIDVGSTVNLIQYGAGAVTVTAASGVTLNGVSAGSGDIATRYRDVVTLTKIATDEWLAFGGIDEVA